MTTIYMVNPLPEDLDEVNAIQRDVEATKPPGARMEEYMHSEFSFGTGRSVAQPRT
jgi:hypothetical protein